MNQSIPVLLPCGITGFAGSGAKSPAGISPAEFKRMIHAMAQDNRMTVSCMDTALSGKNFFWAACQKYGNLFFILVNSRYPYAAFADQVGFCRVHFTEAPRAFVFPSGDDLFVLPPRLLNQNWQEQENTLSAVELSQLRYWQPVTAGEIIFNFWD